MPAGYVHRIDPVLVDLGGVYLWWYGAGFALGFLHLHRVVIRDHARLGLSRRAAWSLSIAITVGVLAGGRGLQIVFDEWPFYRDHPAFVPAFWLGGMATHGLLLGAAAAIAAFAVGLEGAVPGARRHAGDSRRVPDGRRPSRQLHRRPDRRRRDRRVVGRAVPVCRGVPSSRRAV